MMIFYLPSPGFVTGISALKERMNCKICTQFTKTIRLIVTITKNAYKDQHIYIGLIGPAVAAGK